VPSHGIAPEGESLFVRQRTAFPPETEGRTPAFPSGDLPEPPGGPKGGRPEKPRNGGRLAFSAAGARTPALHREKQNARTSAILHSAAALWVRRFSVPGQGIAVKAAMGAAEFPPAERHPP
jgi:hypothetical protein